MGGNGLPFGLFLPGTIKMIISCLKWYTLFLYYRNPCTNNKMRKLSYEIIIILSLLICSCSDDDNGITLENRNEALFGQWEYTGILSDTAVDINGDGTVNIDLFNSNEIRQCLKDDLTFFSARGGDEKNSFSVNENSLSCGVVPAFQNVEEDNYELLDNVILRFDNQNDMEIVEFTNNKLVLDQEDFLDEQNVVITYTFKRSQ